MNTETTKTSCPHTPVATGDALPFFTGVAVEPYTTQNRAAHGGVRYVETCSHCGAERERLVNGLHEEVSPWGPSLAKRRAHHARLYAQAQACIRAITPVTLTRGDGLRATVRVDRHGFVCVDTDREHTDADVRALLASPHLSAFIAAAQEARRAVRAAEDAEVDAARY